MDDDPRAAAQEYLIQADACLELGSEILARRGELGQQWSDIHRRLVHRIRDAQPNPSTLAERDALLGKANELAGQWETMCGNDMPLEVGLDGLRTSAGELTRVTSDPASRPDDIGACLALSFQQFVDIAQTLGTAAQSTDAFTVSLRSFETAAEGYLFGRQSRIKPARRLRVYRILFPIAAATVPILLIVVLIAIVLAVSQ